MTEIIRQKIFFVYPPSVIMNREDRCQQPTKELLVIPPLPPTDLMYLAAIAENCGYEARIKDFESSSNVYDKIKLGILYIETGNVKKGINVLDEVCVLEPDLIITSTPFKNTVPVLWYVSNLYE